MTPHTVAQEPKADGTLGSYCVQCSEQYQNYIWPCFDETPEGGGRAAPGTQSTPVTPTCRACTTPLSVPTRLGFCTSCIWDGDADRYLDERPARDDQRQVGDG